MATGDIVKPCEIVKANNELFRCKYTIKDVVAGRIFMAFASLVDHKDVKENQSFVEYSISADSILSDNCMGGDNYKQLHDAARSLIDQKIELKISERECYFYTLFSKIGYKNGTIIGEFHKDLMPFFLIAKERFTKMQLSEYMQLPSIYSQAIFGFLKSWSDRQEVTISLKELHTILDIPQSLRKNFKDFRIRVLEKAHKDINEKTSLCFDYEAIKSGRAVSEIKFKFIKNIDNNQDKNIKNKKTMQSALSIDPQVKNKLKPLLDAFLAKFPQDKAFHLNAGIKWYGFNDKGIAPLAEDVPEDNELGVIEFLENWETSHADKKNKS